MIKKIILPLLTIVFFISNLSAAQKIITFTPSLKNKNAKTFEIKKAGGKFIKDLWLINAIVADFPENTKNSEIKSLKNIIRVEEDIYQNWLSSEYFSFNGPLPNIKKMLTNINETQFDYSLPSLPKTEPQTKANIPWGIDRINAPAVWSYNQGEGVKVAILDTGVDYRHPDLKGNYKNGYNAVSPGSNALDDHGHGTHVAGTVAAVNNSLGVVGVAPKVDLYAVKVLGSTGGASYSNIIDGIQWCVRKKMQIINMSLGARSGTFALKRALSKARKAGITIVAATGNDGHSVNAPAKYSYTIAVSALTTDDDMAGFSSRGKEVDFIAPGVRILSTYKSGKYARMSGTSMASPHVAGLAALTIAAGNNTPDKVREALINAAVDLGLKAIYQGHGLIDATRIK